MKTRTDLPLHLRVLLVVTLLLTALSSPVMAVNAGYALSFDGSSDFVTLATTLSMMAPTWTTAKTVSLWVKPDGPGEVCNIVLEVASCDAIFGDRPRFWGIARGVRSGEDRIWVFNFDGDSDMVGVDYIPGEWVHITLLHDGGVLQAYKNGVLVGSVPSGPTQQPPITVPHPVLQLGGVIMNADRNWTFRGLIDEVQIWDVARSTAEIRQEMNSILVGDEPGLVAYYRMSDGTGLTLTDDSIHNWNGVLHDGGDGVPPDGAPPQWVPSDAFAPTANDDTATTAEDTPVTLPVLANDLDPDGDALTVTAVGPAAHGMATTDGATVTYTPNTNFYGTDSFLYTISNTVGRTTSAQVTVIVTPVNDDPPVAVDDAATTKEGTAVIIQVLANDSDPDGDPLTVIAAGQAAHGTVNTDGVTVTYTPVAGFIGADSFPYTISDGNGGTAAAQVNITITQRIFPLYLPLISRQ